MMIYANIDAESEFYPVGVLFENEADFCDALKDPEVYGARNILRFMIRGEDYQERKACLQNLAVSWTYADQGGLSWGELAAIQDFFRTNGRRYGLLREFRENCIC